MKDNSSLRLIWKEYREGWPVILAFLVLPGITSALCVRFPESIFLASMALAVVIGVPFTAVLWASEKQKLVKQGRDILEAFLPFTPIQEWLFSFLLPSVIVGICGSWMYMLYKQTLFGEDLHPSVLTGILCTTSAYMLSSFLSRYISNLLGILAGTVWILFTFTIEPPICLIVVPIGLALMALGMSKYRKLGSQPISSSAITVLMIVSGLVIVSAFVIPKNVYILLHNYVNINRTGNFGIRTTYFSGVGRYKTSNNTDYIKYQDIRNGFSASPKAMYMKESSHGFPSESVPIAVDENRRVYILTQKPKDTKISVSRWDTVSGQVEQIGSFTSRRSINMKTITRWSQIVGGNWVGPVGKRLLLNLQSPMGSSHDLWLIDLKTDKCKLLLMNEEFAWLKTTWTDDKVYLTETADQGEIEKNPLEINTKDYTVRSLVGERNTR